MYDLTSMLVGASTRVVQAMIEASPTLLCGLLVAGVFRRMLGPAKLKRLFGNNAPKGLLIAWGLGMLLPVCSFGVIPILRELRRAGLSGGAILAFGLAAPLFNPISFLYGLTLSEPVAVFCFALCSLVVVTLVGWTWDRVVPSTNQIPAEDSRVEYGTKRLTAVVVSAAREWVGPTMGYVAVGLAGVGVLAAALPHGILQTTMAHDDPTSPILMSAVALPAFISPIKAMMQIGLMFDHANSIGAALVLLVLGAGTNLATFWWVQRNFGWKSLFVWMILLVLCVYLFAFGFENPLRPDVAPVPHTHAFDDFCSPFSPGQANVAPLAQQKIKDAAELFESVCLLAMACLTAVGLGIRILDRRDAIERWLGRPRVAPTRLSTLDFVIPGPVLAAAALVGLIGFSVVGCFVYYPPREECFTQMSAVRADALGSVLSGEKELAIRYIRRWDDLSRKLEVGEYLRKWSWRNDLHAKAEEFREALEEIRDLLLDDETEHAKEHISLVSQHYEAFKEAFTTGKISSVTPLQEPHRHRHRH